MTLPVVTAPSGETSGCGRRAAQRGSGAEVAARRDGTGRPGSPTVGSVPTLRAGGDRSPSGAPRGLRSTDSGTEVLEAGPTTASYSRFQPALVPSPHPSRSLTISRFPASPRVLPTTPTTNADHRATRTGEEPRETVDARQQPTTSE